MIAFDTPTKPCGLAFHQHQTIAAPAALPTARIKLARVPWVSTSSDRAAGELKNPSDVNYHSKVKRFELNAAMPFYGCYTGRGHPGAARPPAPQFHRY